MRADGTVTIGERLIDPEQAEVITRIFREYDAGLSARAIAAALNDEGVASPDSGKGDGRWGPSTISGNWRRSTGILNNKLYIGPMVWNRQSFVNDPQTQKRQARPNPPELTCGLPVHEVVGAASQMQKAPQDAGRRVQNSAHPGEIDPQCIDIIEE